MKYLIDVLYKLPNKNKEFTKSFLDYLSHLGNVENEELRLNLSENTYSPSTKFSFSERQIPQVHFNFSDNSSFSVDITNVTGITKQSPHEYKHIAMDEYLNRAKDLLLKAVDHTGFNLPYFGGIHPQILELREKLKETCLYHTFPKELADEPWDFILPGTKEEIESGEVNYDLIRRPKIEIVSFSKSSTPLIQIDLQVEAKYEDFKKLFPEGIDVPEIKCVWVYIQNDFGIDICMVLNEFHDGDWSHYFNNSRL
ncbi:MAG: hypothetical protein KBD46_00160 [Candidatus Levybacteria bacterium]|nr:hypothetical protein [Candidatus Levybacteria bacterium]